MMDDSILNSELGYSFAKKHSVFVKLDDNKSLKVYYKKPLKPNTIVELQRKLDCSFDLVELDEDHFLRQLAQYYSNKTSEAQDIAEDIGDTIDLDLLADNLPEPEDLMEAEDDAPVIRLINAMLTEAIKKEASDIHIEPFENRLQIRFRVDGVMQTILEPPRKISALIISRIKVMSKLDIAEKRVPQDGRISLRVAGRPVDVRVSTLPSGHGERIVLRLLDKQSGRLELSSLGMSDGDKALVAELLKVPHGIILVTGPTGSGKTTSLYAAISQLNNASRSILTVEDPIEYYLDGIGQTQVNIKTDMSFARGLKAILRQDPDVVMVGEIRDTETAVTAVQASLTGHLVLSTLHTNSAVGAITRLRDMGIEPFLLSSSLAGVVAQRLVRKLCEDCKTQVDTSAIELEQLALKQTTKIYHSVGCKKCNYSGYIGRMGMYEVIKIDHKMKQMIHDEHAEKDIEKQARLHYKSLHQDGIRLVLEGKTTLEEILRVSQGG